MSWTSSSYNSLSLVTCTHKTPQTAQSQILEGNIIHILNLLWQIIVHYQITNPSCGAKTLLLKWLKTCLPEKEISNFTTDWRNGFLLSSLINFCDSSLMIDHLWLDNDEANENVQSALLVAEEHLGVPRLLKKEDFTTDKPDERCIMTYLSYFCSGLESPGQKMLLEWIEEQTGDDSIRNFTDAWVDGNKLGLLTNVLSSNGFTEYDMLQDDPDVETCKLVMEVADKLLGVDMTLTPEEFADQKLNPVLRMIYLMQFFFSTRLAKVHELHLPEETGQGATVWLDISLPQGSTSKVESNVSGVAVGEVPVNIESRRGGKFRIKFDAELPDVYTLNVTVGGSRIKGSPFAVDMTPADPLSVKLSNSILPKKAGIPVIMMLNTKNAGHGKLTAEVYGEKSGEVPFSVDTISPTLSRISFIPLQSDTYTVEARLDGQYIKGSPFNIPLNDLIQPEMVKLGKPDVGEIGEPVTISIDTSAAGKGELLVKCTGQKAGEVEVTCDPPESPTEISFIPPIEDVYTVTVTFDSTEVVDSPIEVRVYEHPPIAKNVRLVSTPSGGVKGGQEIVVGFDTSNAGRGELTASCIGRKHGEIEIKVKEIEEHRYNVICVPPEGDVYEISIFWSNEPVRGSPFKLNLIPTSVPDASKCSVVGFPKPSSLLLIHEPIEFQVNAKEAGRGYLDIVIEIENEDDDGFEPDRISMASTGTRDSDDATNFEASEVLSPIQEEVGDKNPVNQEKENRADGGHEQEKAETAGAGETSESAAGAGAGAGADNEKAEDKIASSITENEPQQQKEAGENEEEKNNIEQDLIAPSLVIDPSLEDPSIYNVSYTPVQEGKHLLNISWSDSPIPGSPMSLNITKPLMAHFNEPIAVNVKTVFKRKNLKTRLQKRDGTVVKQYVKMDKIKTGDYLLIFSPKEPGVYILNVTAKNKPIERSPFIINYIKPDIEENLKVTVSGLAETAYKGEPVSFLIETTDGDLLDKVLVTRRPSQMNEGGSTTPLPSTASDEHTSIQLERNEDGTITATFVPHDIGEEELDIRVKNKPILGSPFRLAVKHKDTDAEATDEAILGLNLNEYRFIVDTSSRLKLFCQDLGEGELEVFSKPATNADINITEDEVQKKIYWVVIVPRKAGKCDLMVRYGGNDIYGSPFVVNFLARGNAKKCVLMSQTDCKFDPKEVEKTFCVSTKGAGKGKVTAVIRSMSSIKNIKVKVEQHSKYHYHVKFVPSEGLNYILSVRFDDIDIQGSPYKILLGNPSHCRVRGDGLTKAWSGQRNQFIVESENAGPGNLKILIESDKSDEFDRKPVIKLEPKISQTEEFKYEVSYMPEEPGIYWVTVEWSGTNIPGSPFRTICRKPLEPNDFSVIDPAPITHDGKDAETVIKADKEIIEEDKLAVALYTEDERKFLGEATLIDNTTYSIFVRPPECGKYSVHVLWDDKHIRGSPFEIENIPPPEASEFSVEAAEKDGGVISVKVVGPEFSFRYGKLTASIDGTNLDEPEEVPFDILPLSTKECAVNFSLSFGKEYDLSIFYDDVHITGSPFHIISTDASQCYSKGAGLKVARANHPNTFSVFTENAGLGELKVEIKGGEEGSEEIIPEISTVNETQYNVSYMPTTVGQYKILVYWDVHQIPGSPFEIICCDPLRYSIPKPPKEGSLGVPIKIGVKEASMGPNCESLEVFARGKDHTHHEGQVAKGSDGNYVCTVQPPELGKYVIHIKCNGFNITGSPFKIKNMPAPIPEKVSVSGRGISNGRVGDKGKFQINVSEAGHGFINLKVQGPKDGFSVNLNHNKLEEKLIHADYNPTHPGQYSISVLWSGVHVKDSPFKVSVEENTRFSRLVDPV